MHFEEKCPELDLAKADYVRNEWTNTYACAPFALETERHREKVVEKTKRKGGKQKNKLSKQKFNFKQVCTKVHMDI